jgi:hypothetical protein
MNPRNTGHVRHWASGSKGGFVAVMALGFIALLVAMIAYA